MPSRPHLLSERFGPRRPCLVVNPGGGAAAPRASWLQPSGENNFPAAARLPRAANSFRLPALHRSEEHTSELQSLMRISYAVFCLKKKKKNTKQTHATTHINNR